MKLGFDNKKYIKIQSENIKKKIKLFDNKLYLECGGKLFDDYHAMRVLPGLKVDAKLNVLKEFKRDMEVIFCISAKDIERNKIRAEHGITYDMEVLRLMDNFKNLGISINSVVITLFDQEPHAIKFKNKLENLGIKVYIHTYTKGYPTDVETIVSDEGYGANPYIETTKPLVVVTAPGPCSGKLATCLSQLYHEYKMGRKAGYAKFETFPVWSLPLKHPVNMAYEAATADLKDVNMIDPFHMEAYGETAVNYNRDIEVFPVLKNILHKIIGSDIYKSPTDMGVNMVGFAIKNNDIVETSSKKEIVRRYFQAVCDAKMGLVDETVPQRIKMLMNELNIDENYIKVRKPALDKSLKEKRHVISLELPNGKIITGKQTELLSPTASLFLNAVKELTKIPDKINLLSPAIIEPIIKYKPKSLNSKPYYLQLQEVLIALSIASVTNPVAEKALSVMEKLNGCEAHATYIVQNGDLTVLKSLKINLTCEPVYFSNDLYFNN